VGIAKEKAQALLETGVGARMQKSSEPRTICLSDEIVITALREKSSMCRLG